MAEVAPSALERRLSKASKVLRAIGDILEDVAGLLRQLVHVAGWLVLFVGCISLLIHPRLSPEHLVVPGAGTLAVLQSLIKLRRPLNSKDQSDAG
jgi:hypothetical protein